MPPLRAHLVHFEGKGLRRERLQARGLSDAGGPDDVAEAAAHGQQRQRARGQEALPGGVVGVLRPHGRHDAALMVAPRKGPQVCMADALVHRIPLSLMLCAIKAGAASWSAGGGQAQGLALEGCHEGMSRACQLPHSGARPVRAHDQPGPDGLPAVEAHLCQLIALHACEACLWWTGQSRLSLALTQVSHSIIAWKGDHWCNTVKTGSEAAPERKSGAYAGKVRACNEACKHWFGVRNPGR